MRPELRAKVWAGDGNMNTVNAEIVEAMELNEMTHGERAQDGAPGHLNVSSLMEQTVPGKATEKD